MAVEIKGNLVRRHATKYDWDKWLDGKQWMLSQGIDFEVTQESFRSAAFIAVRKRGLNLTTRRVEDEQGRPAICLQAYSPK